MSGFQEQTLQSIRPRLARSAAVLTGTLRERTRGKMVTKEQMKMELMACLQEQIYPGRLNQAGLVLIGLWDLEGNLIERIVEENGTK
jgi:hypothetical protein